MAEQGDRTERTLSVAEAIADSLSSNPGESSIHTAAACIPGYDLPVVDVPHLVALKLYAGGPRNRSDVLELLERNRDIDRSEIRRVCEQFNLTADLDDMLRDV